MTIPVSQIKYNPIFKLKVSINESIYSMFPACSLTWEILEKVRILFQHLLIDISYCIPTLEVKKGNVR